MVDMSSEIRHYDDIYRQHISGDPCAVSVASLGKARKRVRQVLAAFGIRVHGMRILDIGSGLGYIAEALRLEGASVVGIDASAIAIQRAAEKFPLVDWRHVLFPAGLSADEHFDLVWILDVSTLNTFNVAEMRLHTLDGALDKLHPKGRLLVGWHSDFSGTVRGNWSHWTFQTIDEMRRALGFSHPRVPQARWVSLSWLTMRICKAIGKSFPIFLIRD